VLPSYVVSRIDAINQRTMAASDVVAGYASQDALSPPERALLALVRDETRGRAILDLGVGGGRTVPALTELGADYVGLDYSREMVDACRRRFPGVRLEHGDARDLSRFAAGAFQLVVFSCNGLGMLDDGDRRRVLAEVHRVLEDGGAFLFSTHNRRSAEHDAGFRLPPFEPSANPLRLAIRSARFARRVIARVRNRRRHLPLETRAADYSIINDVCHDYGTMLYYIDLAAQRRQLEAAGFRAGAVAYDLAGHRIDVDSDDNSIALLARK
jgi:SAM-dependent methyltransferase